MGPAEESEKAPGWYFPCSNEKTRGWPDGDNQPAKVSPPIFAMKPPSPQSKPSPTPLAKTAITPPIPPGMKIDPAILVGSKLAELTEPVIVDPIKEEFVGDAVLSHGLRYIFCSDPALWKVSTGIIARNVNSIESNNFLGVYAAWLKIQGGADEMERRIARLFHRHGFEALLTECRIMHKVWFEWRQTWARPSPTFEPKPHNFDICPVN